MEAAPLPCKQTSTLSCAQLGVASLTSSRQWPPPPSWGPKRSWEWPLDDPTSDQLQHCRQSMYSINPKPPLACLTGGDYLDVLTENAFRGDAPLGLCGCHGEEGCWHSVGLGQDLWGRGRSQGRPHSTEKGNGRLWSCLSESAPPTHHGCQLTVSGWSLSQTAPQQPARVDAACCSETGTKMEEE